MNNLQMHHKTTKHLTIIMAIFLPLLLSLFMANALAAQEDSPRAVEAAVLTAVKNVNLTQAAAGSTVKYTIVVTNSGNAPAPSAMITDTLPTELTIISNTLSSSSGGSFGTSGQLITWTGSINNGTQVTLSFDAVLTDTVTDGTVITNTAAITGSGTLLTDTAVFTVLTEYKTYLPIIFKPLPAPTLTSVSIPVSTDGYVSSKATASWTAVDGAIGYELVESHTPDFASKTVLYSGTNTSFEISHTPTWNNGYYYYVRALHADDAISSGGSNIVAQSFIYLDEFNDPASGWAMRREDTDDVNNSAYYLNGQYKMKIHGRWDSLIAGPLTPVPATWNSYRIDTKVQLGDGIDNLHSYGIIWGADWNDKSIPCPYKHGNAYRSCYNQYYRLNVIWSNPDDYLTVGVKRIDGHSYATDKDITTTLMRSRQVYVSNPSGWNTWRVDVHSNGSMTIYVNGQHVTTVTDTHYVGGGRYFGLFASSDEYLGTAAYIPYYRVSPLD